MRVQAEARAARLEQQLQQFRRTAQNTVRRLKLPSESQARRERVEAAEVGGEVDVDEGRLLAGAMSSLARMQPASEQLQAALQRELASLAEAQRQADALLSQVLLDPASASSSSAATAAAASLPLAPRRSPQRPVEAVQHARQLGDRMQALEAQLASLQASLN